jgi:nitronate monooxygenase
MFLVSNEAMVQSAMQAGIMGCFPSLNYRNKGEYEQVLVNLNRYRAESGAKGNYGVNLIVQKTNPLLKEHLEASVRQKVPFYITSLGSPKEVIEAARSYGGKVYCDVTNVEHAGKAAELGCDGFIAVGQGAGGHAGPYPLQILVPALRREFPNIPVISAGGVASGEGIVSMLALGAQGVSIGTAFIATNEAGVNDAYKQAVVDARMGDIVMTDKISGTPCTIIDTPYAKKIGYRQNWLERQLSTNARTKKYFKMLVQLRGMKRLEQSIRPANYQTLWCAGQSVEMVRNIRPVQQVVTDLETETMATLERLSAISRA